MGGNTVKFNNIRLNKKQYNKSKQAIELCLVTVDQTVISGKFRHSEKD